MDEDSTGTAERLTGLLVLGMVGLMLLGYLVFRSGKATVTGQEPSAARSTFIMVNAATLSGFELTTGVSEYRPLGQVMVFMLISGGAFMTLISGGWAVTRVLSMPYTDEQVVRAAFFEFLLVLLAALLLVGPNPPGQPRYSLWAAIFQATSALANAGHVLGAAPSFQDPRVHLILLPLAVIGGLGVPVLLDISSAVRLGHRLHSHTRLVLAGTAGVYLIGMLLIGGIEWYGGVETSQAAIRASAESLNSRTLGMPLGSFVMLSPASQWVVLLLMFIGGSPAGTAGGLKTTTAIVLTRDSWRLWNGQAVDRLFGLAVMWATIYLLAILATTIVLALAQPQMPGERMIFLAVSAITNTGLSHAPISLTDMGAYSLCVAMLFGRFVPLLVLWHAVGSTMEDRKL